MSLEPPPLDALGPINGEQDPEEKRQATAAIWRRWWQALDPVARGHFITAQVAAQTKQDGARDAMESWHLASWRAAASSNYHRGMASTEEALLAIHGAGATRELYPADYMPPAPNHADGSGFDLLAGGAVHALGEADDSGEFTTPAASPSLQWATNLADEYLARCRDQSGVVVDRDKKDQRDAAQADLRKQSHFLAGVLEENGEISYRHSAWRLWRWWIHSGHVEEVPAFRNICLFPLVAARNRRPIVQAAEWWLQNHPWCRFWTFTGGKRCRAGQVNGRLRKLAARISDLNAQPFMKQAGAEIVLRALELGSIEYKETGDPEKIEAAAGGLIEHDDAGGWFHPHAHCLVYLARGRMDPGPWNTFLLRVWAYWKDHWFEGGRIQDARECVKYVTKPGEMVQLADRNPQEFVTLHKALLGLHLLQPMGSLRKEIAHWRGAGLELYREQTKDGERWQLRRSVNRGFFSRAQPSGLRMSDGSIGSEAAMLRYFQMNHKGPPEPDTSLLDVCRVVSYGMPSAGPLYVKEPVINVLGTRFDWAQVITDQFVGRVLCETYDEFWAGVARAKAEARAAGIMVHTGTTTVIAGYYSIQERSPPPSRPVWDLDPGPPDRKPLSEAGEKIEGKTPLTFAPALSHEQAQLPFSP